MEPVDGGHLTSERAEAPSADDAGPGASGVYRPRYELVAEEILQLIGELLLRPGDRMPTEKELAARLGTRDRKSTRLNSSHSQISYAVFCLKKKKIYIARSRRDVQTRFQGSDSVRR